MHACLLQVHGMPTHSTTAQAARVAPFLSLPHPELVALSSLCACAWALIDVRQITSSATVAMRLLAWCTPPPCCLHVGVLVDAQEEYDVHQQEEEGVCHAHECPATVNVFLLMLKGWWRTAWRAPARPM